MPTTLTPRQEALAMAARGHRILPLHSVKEDGTCTCGLLFEPNGEKHKPGKHPFAAFTARGLKDATSDLAIIAGWFDAHYWLNYGICTDGAMVIDTDPKHHGDESWAAMANQPARAVSHSWRSRTGSNGLHLFFKNTAEIRNSVGKLDKGIDVRGKKGYVVGPGCKHESGRTYQWEPQCSPDEAPLADPPAWLIEVIKLRTYCGTVTPPDEWRRRAREPHHDGERNDTLLKIAGHLISLPGSDPLEILELLIGWDEGRNQPPLGADRVRKIIEDHSARERQKIASLLKREDWINASE
jgi:hypothetical protein